MIQIVELFHVLNRGVDKRTIVLDERDRVRFVHDLYALNDARPVNNLTHNFRSKSIAGPRFSADSMREPLVTIHGWCLMKNHYHLLLTENVSGGITSFLRKFNIGYAKYFNERHERSGALFQGRTKKIPIERDAQFLYILHYIHLNPLDYCASAYTWREGHVGNRAHALHYLAAYRWSSFLDYNGTHNFPSVIDVTLFNDVFSKSGGYGAELLTFVRDIEEYPTLRQLRLE